MPEIAAPEVRSRYRPELDGIRALAILSVALGHAEMRWLPGGFTGVDIFFVLSGYLIGGQIYAEARAGRFSYLQFYKRRAKRILPAYFAVLSAVLLAALVLCVPEEAREIARTAFAAVCSISNVLFWIVTNYFSRNSQMNPLLMTWSLGVEEQFYLVIPLLMVGLARLRRRWMLPAILTVCVASFLLSALALETRPAMVFYLLPARAWELGAGVALAAAELEGRRWTAPSWLRETLSAAGLALMVAPMFLIQPSTAFPGPAALPSVLGTVLMIAMPASWLSRRLLAQKPAVFVGRISYSWYLWHWPLLAFLRMVHWGTLPRHSGLAAVAVAFVLAVGSYYWIEQPFRASKREPIPLLLRYAAVSLALLPVCALIWRTDGLPQRNAAMATYKWTNSTQLLRADPCLAMLDTEIPNRSAWCVNKRAGQPSVVVLGDSHAAAISPALRELAARSGYGVLQLTRAACLPLNGAGLYNILNRAYTYPCLRFNQQAVAMVESDPDVRVVVLTGYWSTAFQREPVPSWLVRDAGHPGTVQTDAETEAMFLGGLREEIEPLRRAGKQVVVMQDAPVLDFDPFLRMESLLLPPRRMVTEWLAGGEAIDPGRALIGRLHDRQMAEAVLRKATEGDTGVRYYDFTANFCDGGKLCAYREGTTPLYGDLMHLSPAGADLALRGFQLPVLPDGAGGNR